MSDEAYWILACSVWEHKASPQETAQFETWAQQEVNAEKLSQYRELWQMTAPGPAPTFNAHENWNELESRLSHSGRGPRSVDRGPTPTRLFPMLAKIAASLLLLAIAWFYLPRLFSEELVTMQTKVGEHRLVVLPDSTHVWLNANSIIRYPKAFADSRRKVYLEGEAFLDVTADPSRPFSVESGDAEIKVLGTSFNVNAKANMPVTVTVVTGKVQFGPLANEALRVVLLPGDAGTFHAQQGTLASKVSDNPRFMEWHNHTLNFNKTPLAQVFETLANVNDIHIQTANAPPDTCVFTGVFENASVEEILDVLSATVGFEWSGSKGEYQVVNISCQ
jgi:transmembrane sensor